MVGGEVGEGAPFVDGVLRGVSWWGDPWVWRVWVSGCWLGFLVGPCGGDAMMGVGWGEALGAVSRMVW